MPTFDGACLLLAVDVFDILDLPAFIVIVYSVPAVLLWPLKESFDKHEKTEQGRTTRVKCSRCRDDEKPTLGWMYKEEKPELDEYLLGRRIDKHIDQDLSKETDPGLTFACRSYQDIETSNWAGLTVARDD